MMILLKPMAMASDGYGSCPGVGIVFVFAFVVVVVVVVVFRMRNWNRGGGGGHWNGRWSHTNKVVKAASSCLNGVSSPCPVNLSVLSYPVLSRTRRAAGINALLPAPPIANPLSDSRNFFYKKPGAFPLLRPVLSSHVFSSSLLFSGLSGCPMLCCEPLVNSSISPVRARAGPISQKDRRPKQSCRCLLKPSRSSPGPGVISYLIERVVASLACLSLQA